MNFLSPQYLWGLLALIPLIAAYLLKVKPRRQPTNAWFLWQKVFEEKNSSSLFSKMRSFISLLLMILVILLISFGLSEPQFSKRDSRDVIIVIDQSASMNCKDGETSRLEQAKAKAHDVVRSLSAGQRASVAVVNQNLQFVTHLSSNAHGLHQTIDEIQSTNLPDTIAANDALLEMISDKEGENNSHRIVLFTDGCGAYSQELLEKIDVVTVGDKLKEANIGIVAADIQPVLGKDEATAMVQLVNSGDKDVEVEIEFFHKETEEIAQVIKVKAKPGKNDPLFFDLPAAQAGEWLIRNLREDAFAEDNEANLVLYNLPAITVSIPEKNNYFYQRCIEAFTKTSGSLQLVMPSESPKIGIYHGSVPDKATGDIILFAPKSESKLWTNLSGEVAVNLALAEEKNHPLLKHSDLNTYAFPGAKKLSVPETARVIVRSDEGLPLIYQVNEVNRSIVVVNLDPSLDDFFLFTGFVALVYDSAMYLSGNDTRLASSYAAGQSYSMEMDGKLVSPSGKEAILAKGETFLPEEIGFYQYAKDGKSETVASSLLSLQESKLASMKTQENQLALSSGYPLSFWLIVVGLVVLVVESLMYHRRKAD